MNAVVPAPRLSFEAYLAGEQVAGFRSEFAAGQVFAMAGGTAAHNRIAGNAYLVLRSAAKPCPVFFADMLLRLDDLAYYPDVFVVCDPDDRHRLYRTRPCLIIEVLSESTQTIDRGEKLYNYRQIPSVETILLVAQDRRRVDVYRRSALGFLLTTLDEQGEIALECPPCVLSLQALYEGVEFDQAQPAP